MAENLANALRYAEHGWRVLPVHTTIPEEDDATRLVCSCGREDCPSPGKHPRVPRGVKWCEEVGERSMSQQSLGMALKERGFQHKPDKKGRGAWLGIRLRQPEEATVGEVEA